MKEHIITAEQFYDSAIGGKYDNISVAMRTAIVQTMKDYSELVLKEFVKDWYKNNPLVSEGKQLQMIDEFLAVCSRSNKQ